MNEIYIKNHHPKYNFLMDIREFNKLPKEQIPSDLFDLDILDGSPPCTTFSMAGSREESWGKKKKFREGQAEQTLDDLSFVFIETVNKLKPKCVIMENVEGLLLGEAWGYVQRIYKDFSDIGYDVKHYLCKGEEMGVPQTRHRVFFIAFKKDIHFNFNKLDMFFNYEPVTYGKIKSGIGREYNHDTQLYRTLCEATKDDLRISDVFVRKGEKEKYFGSKIAWEENVLQTITAKLDYSRGKEKTRISEQDIIYAQTFPEDYDFGEKKWDNVAYICGMSVPPVMIKRIVGRIIDTGIFKERKEKKHDTSRITGRTTTN
jgi:DNA (cytosine-5)-methyltransferase 1